MGKPMGMAYMGCLAVCITATVTVMAGLFWLMAFCWAFYSIAKGGPPADMVEALYPVTPLLAAIAAGVTCRYITEGNERFETLPCFIGLLLGSGLFAAGLTWDTSASDSLLLTVLPFRFAMEHVTLLLATPLATFFGVLMMFPMLQWVL